MLRTPKGLIVEGNVIPQEPTMSNMTKNELTFSLLVEQVRDLFGFSGLDERFLVDDSAGVV